MLKENTVDNSSAIAEATATAALAQLTEKRTEILNIIKSQEEQQSQRLEGELQFEQEKKKDALKARLAAKTKVRAAELAHAPDATLSEAEALAAAEAEVVVEEAQGLVEIEAEIKQKKETEQEKILYSIKDSHSKDLAKLDDEMLNQEKVCVCCALFDRT